MPRMLRVLLAILFTAGAAQAVDYDDLIRRPHGPPTAHLAYGPAPDQFVELWLPKGDGPHPVVVLLHGGCWLAEFPGLELMNPMAQALRAKGFAVWNVEYRRVHRGGGYPETFNDVSTATDMLRGQAARYHLDLSHVVAVGHSAGGHLAMWLAARPHLPKNSPLRTANPLPITGVMSLAGILDPKGYRDGGDMACGGPDIVDGITGAAHRKGDVYADTSPQALLPIGVKQVVVSGGFDTIVPEHWRLSYVKAAVAAGDKSVSLGLPQAGHFELIDPQGAEWPQILAAIQGLAR